MQRIEALLRITKLLNEENIWFVNLKGPLLSQRIYGDPIYRSFRDFDILVKPEDVNRVLKLLKNEGYQFTGFEWPKSKRKQQIAFHFLNQAEMIHEQSGIMIEIHWKLFSARITTPENIHRLIQKNIEPVEFGGQKINRFSLEFELLYLVVHGGIHAWFRLKWLIDVHEILKRKTIKWQKFNYLVTKFKAQKLVDICNFVLAEYFPGGAKIPFAGSRAIDLAAIAIEQSKQPEGDPHISRTNTYKLLRYRMKLFTYLPYKLDVSKVVTFCKTDLKYGWLPPYRFIYYLFRPVGYILRFLKILA